MASKRKNENSHSQRASNTHNSRKKTSKRADNDDNNRKEKSNIVYYLVIAILAIAISVTHRNHIANLFENDRHFSHLSTLERELAFRTEMGLYYSYFKTIIEAPTFSEGMVSVMYDNITEYPLTINVLKRFNLYPEVVLAAAYRMYEATNAWFKRPTKMCWTVNRGQGYSPVQSCEGLGEPSYFYTEAAFTLNGIMMGIFFLFGTFLSGSVFGGILTVASYFYNHGECTRVQWTPPLRESFAYPFFVLQMLIVTYVLKTDKLSHLQSVFIAIATISFMLPWQFAQFALMTQTVAVFGTYVLGYIGSNKIKIILYGQTMGLLFSYIALFGNEMLLTSFFASCLATVWIIVSLETVIEKIKFRILIWGVQGVLLVVGTVCLKFIIAKVLQVADDAHIGEIFKSKFTDFKNFHTMLYTCAAEFDFMQAETPWKVLKTLLSPCVAAVVLISTFIILKREYEAWKKSDSDSEDVISSGPDRSKPGAEIVYHLFQLIAFTAMAILIMRLKLFWTPHLCLMTSLLASRQFFGWIGRREIHYGVVALILGGMSIQGFINLQDQWNIKGEFSNYPMEELIEWIKAKTPKNAVFAGPMPTMATVKLCTLRPIVNHPHYEDAGLRERTKKVYTMYSRKPAAEVKQNLLDLKVDYAILENSWCVRQSRAGCGMADIWDLEDKNNRHNKVPVCTQLKNNPEPHFKRVFRNNVYDVLKVNV